MNANDRRAAFLQSAISAARASQKANGIPASVTLAQVALESADGSKHMSSANNYFGIKAHKGREGAIDIGPIATGYTTLKTGEVRNGAPITETAKFRTYNSMADSFSYHAAFLSAQPRYGPALAAYRSNGDAEAFAHGLQAGGYATDPSYANKLVSIMRKHNLTQYDQ